MLRLVSSSLLVKWHLVKPNLISYSRKRELTELRQEGDLFVKLPIEEVFENGSAVFVKSKLELVFRYEGE